MTDDLLIEARKNRHYGVSKLPVMRGDAVKSEHQEVLLSLYGEICSSWRLLTDVRFKLLGLVPTASVVVLIALLSRNQPTEGLSRISQLAVIVFGFCITLGLTIYDRRNSQLYNDLISRGRRIEHELGIDTGHFLGRPEPTDKLVNHSNATNLIYLTALLGWLFALAAILLGWS